jgi:hypothetical protein
LTLNHEPCSHVRTAGDEHHPQPSAHAPTDCHFRRAGGGGRGSRGATAGVGPGGAVLLRGAAHR